MVAQIGAARKRADEMTWYEAMDRYMDVDDELEKLQAAGLRDAELFREKMELAARMDDLVETIEFEKEDFQAIEDKVGRIRGLAMEANFATPEQNRRCLQGIITEANALTNLLHNGLFVESGEAG